MVGKLHEHFLVKRAIDGQDNAAGTVNGAENDFSGYDRVTYIVASGTNGVGGTVDIKVQEAAAAGGSYSDISGSTLPQITTSNDNTVYIIDVPVASAKPVQKVVATVGTATCDFGVVAIAEAKKKAPTQAQTAVVA